MDKRRILVTSYKMSHIHPETFSLIPCDAVRVLAPGCVLAKFEQAKCAELFTKASGASWSYSCDSMFSFTVGTGPIY